MTKPCENCPDKKPAKIVYVVYSGGLEQTLYATLAHAIPARNEQ